MEYFIPNGDVLERFAAAAQVDVSDVERYYLHGRTHQRVNAVADHFPRRRTRVDSYVPVDWDHGTNRPADPRYLGQKAIEKPWRPAPKRGVLGLEDSSRDRFPVADPDEHGRWVSEAEAERARRGGGLGLERTEPSLLELARTALPRH